jgi:hypothetical protein
MKKIKYQSKRVVIAIGNYAVDKVAVEPLDVDKAYDRITGVAVHRVIDAGAANGDYKVGLSNDNGVIHDPTHISSWATAKDDGTNPNERFKELNVDVNGGGQMQCIVNLPAQNLLAAIQVEFVFRLEQDRVRTA